MGQTANLAINPAALPKMPFDATKDLVPVALVAEVPTLLAKLAEEGSSALSGSLEEVAKYLK